MGYDIIIFCLPPITEIMKINIVKDGMNNLPESELVYSVLLLWSGQNMSLSE